MMTVERYKIGLKQIQLNNVPYHGFSDGLDSELHDGDTLTLSLVLIGVDNTFAGAA
jgi:hypothetical protein